MRRFTASLVLSLVFARLFAPACAFTACTLEFVGRKIGMTQ